MFTLRKTISYVVKRKLVSNGYLLNVHLGYHCRILSCLSVKPLLPLSVSSFIKFNIIKRTYNIELIRQHEHLKQTPGECLTALKNGKFLFFYEKSVLIDKRCLEALEKSAGKINSNDELTTQRQYKARWISYSDIVKNHSELEKALSENSILLGIDFDGKALFVLDLPKMDINSEEMIANTYDGIFASMGLAMFLGSTDKNVTFGQAHSLIRWHRINNYCSRCGSETKRNESGSNRVCLSCKKVAYPKPDPAAIVIVTDETTNKCLLVRQHNFPHGMFTAIAGFLEIGETIEDTVRREVAEEVGLELSKVEYISSQHWPLRGTTLMFGFHAVAKPGGKILIDKKELEAAHWFSPNDLKRALLMSGKNPGQLSSSKKKSEKELEHSFWVPPQPTVANSLLLAWLQKYDQIEKL